jgi:hypothetical protein
MREIANRDPNDCLVSSLKRHSICALFLDAPEMTARADWDLCCLHLRAAVRARDATDKSASRRVTLGEDHPFILMLGYACLVGEAAE